MPAAIFPIVVAKAHHGYMPTALRVVLGTSAIGLITIPLWIGFGLRSILPGRQIGVLSNPRTFFWPCENFRDDEIYGSLSTVLRDRSARAFWNNAAAPFWSRGGAL
jgi:hypothetical protein